MASRQVSSGRWTMSSNFIFVVECEGALSMLTGASIMSSSYCGKTGASFAAMALATVHASTVLSEEN